MTSYADFERMRAELRVPGTRIIVWHERILDLSNRLRTEAEVVMKQHRQLMPQYEQQHPLEQPLLPGDYFRPKGMDEMWAQVRHMQDEAEARENSEIIGRLMEYDRQNPLS